MISAGRKAILPLLLALSLAPAGAAEPDARGHLASAAADPAQREALIREGRAAATFCANCHGEAGFSRYTEVPNLASQHPTYVVNQIEAFVSGKRKNEFMQGLMKVLNEREKAGVALAYAGAAAQPASPTPGPRAAEGGEHYQRLCLRCHGAAAGGAESFPRLAGQQPEYLRVSLKRYFTMSGERNYAPMSAAIMQLGEKNIDAMVDYLSSLK